MTEDQYDQELIERSKTIDATYVKTVIIEMAEQGILSDKMLSAIYEGRELKAAQRLKNESF